MTFAVGDKVRIKASVTNVELGEIYYPVEERNGEFVVKYVNYDGVTLSNDWAIYTYMVEKVSSDGE